MRALPGSTRDTLFERLLTYFDTEFLEDCLSTIQGLAPDNNKELSGLIRLKIGQLLISTLRKSGKALDLRRSLITHLSESELSMGVLRDYAKDFSKRKGSLRCQESYICNAATSSEKDKLFFQLLSCIDSAIDTEGAESLKTFSCYHELFDYFLGSLQENTATSRSCFFSQLKEPERNGYFPRNMPKVAVIEQPEGSSHEWRSRVANLLIENARNSHETVIKQMEAMLQDFENRCSNVEEPLADAVRAREESNQQLEASKNLNQQLEEKVRQSTEMMSALRKQLDGSVAQVKDYANQIVHLTNQVDALQTELDTTRNEAQDGIELVTSKARDRELDLMATVAERDDLLEEQQLEIEAISKERAQLQEAVNANTERYQALAQDHENLRQEMAELQKAAAQESDMFRHEITKLQQIMEIRESTNAEKDNRIIALGETNKDLHTENQMLQNKVRHVAYVTRYSLTLNSWSRHSRTGKNQCRHWKKHMGSTRSVWLIWRQNTKKRHLKPKIT